MAAPDRANNPSRRPKLNAFGRTDSQEAQLAKHHAAEVEGQKEQRTKEYGGHPDGYFEIRTNKPSTWRA